MSVIVNVKAVVILLTYSTHSKTCKTSSEHIYVVQVLLKCVDHINGNIGQVT